MSIKEYIYQWKKMTSHKFGNDRGRVFASFIAPVVAGAVASGAYKVGKMGYEEYKKHKKRKRRR